MNEASHYLQKIRDIPRLQPYIKQGVVSTGRQLGKGAFGYVVELQLYGGAVCAGKKIHETFLDPLNKGVQHIVDKFITECELMSQMHHPNIVHFYGLAFLDDSFSPVLVMERLDKSLDDFLETMPAKDIPLSLRLCILYDVAKGLVFLHSYQPPIIHRDLTARNILLTSTNQAKIADLGNSRMIDTEALSRSLSQTPGTHVYMSPEAIGSPAIYDTSLDIFSFGHTALFVFGHRFPSPLLRSNYNDPNSRPPNKLCARSEVERRVAYFEEIERMKEIPPKLIQMVKLCLDNMQECRPTSKKVSEMLGHYKERVEKQRKSLTLLEQPPSPTGPTGGMTRGLSTNQMTKIMGGSQFVMEMQMCHGKKKNQCSKRILHLEDGKLKYQKLTDKKVQELKLDSVTSVEPVYEAPQFRFAVHFEHKKEKQAWYFKADTEEDRNCWVTALRGFINSAQPDLAYEIVDLSPEPPSRAQRREKSRPLPPPPPMRSRASETELLPRAYTEADAAIHQKAQKVAFSRQAASLHDTSKGNYEHFKPHHHRKFHTNTNPSYKVPSTKPQVKVAMPVTKKRDSLDSSSQGQMPDSSKQVKKISLQECKLLGNTSEDYDDVVPKEVQQTHRSDEIYDEIDSRYENITGVPLTPSKPQFFRDRSHVLLEKPIIKRESAASRPRSAEVRFQDEQKTPVRDGTLMPGMNSGNEKKKIMRVRSSSPIQRSHEGERKMLRNPSLPNHRYPAHEDASPQQRKHGPSKPLHELLGTLHIPESNLFEWKLIANGEFGDIYHAKLRNLTGEMVDVAVKTLQAYDDSKDMDNFENEMAISADPLIHHPNIVKVYGLVEGADKIVMEYLPYGDLKSFLSGKNSQLITWLIKYMRDVAEGMTFLSERGLIHRDLAARNILMASKGDSCMTCKVSDFGLLRKLPTDANYYFQTKSSKCPIRWMAPESLEENKFSTASDVWSYGIVIWEMFNPHRVPYEEYINIQVAVKITQGVLLKSPPNCPADIAQIMSSCWKKKSSDRPTFRQLAYQLANRHNTS